MVRIRIHGSHGSFYVNGDTGYTMGDKPPEYADITRVDLHEYCEHYHVDAPPCDLDVLNVGFWYNDGGKRAYEPADEDWRMLGREEWRLENLGKWVAARAVLS